MRYLRSLLEIYSQKREREMVFLQRFSLAWKMYLIVTIIISIAAGIIVGYFVDERKNALINTKQIQLLNLAAILERMFDNEDFNQYVHKVNLMPISQEEKALIINNKYQPLLMGITQENPSSGLGIYSKQIDRVIAIEPNYDPSLLRTVTRPDILKVYETGHPVIVELNESIGWNGRPVLGVSYPIYINGQIIGHTWASYKLADLYEEINKEVINIVLTALGFWLLSLAAIYLVFYRLNHELSMLSYQISKEVDTRDEFKNFPELVPVLESTIELREKLKRKNNLLKWMVNDTPCGLIVIDREQKISYISQYAINHFEKDETASNIGADYGELLYELGISREDSYLVKTLSGSAFSKAKIMRGDKVIQLSTSPILQPDTGEIIAAGAFFWDITEEYKRENVLQETSFKLSRLIDLCPLAILELDSDGCIVNLNKAMVDFYAKNLPHATKHTLVGKSIQDLSIELGIKYKDSLIFRIMGGQEIRNEYIRQLNCDWIVHGIPIFNDITESVAGAIVIYNDITEYEQTKREMARLEYLNAVGETAGSVAHELRNPACTIKGFVELLQKKCKDAHKEYFGIILEELDRMNEIIEDFLSLARTNLIDKMVMDINELLHAMQPLIMSDAIKNGIELEYNLCNSVESLELNPKEIRQLVLNLARNGIDAMKPKGILKISTVKVTDGIKLTIQDNGTGIDQQILNKIFEPFYTSKKNGTGLGLSVCRNIVKGHNGEIAVESEVDKGTTFTIFFPRVVRESQSLKRFEEKF